MDEVGQTTIRAYLSRVGGKVRGHCNNLNTGCKGDEGCECSCEDYCGEANRERVGNETSEEGGEDSE